MSVLETLRGRATIILIAHRLSLVRRCDVVFQLEAGRVIGSGTYDELTKTIRALPAHEWPRLAMSRDPRDAERDALRISARTRVFRPLKQVGSGQISSLDGCPGAGSDGGVSRSLPVRAGSHLTLNVMAFFFALSGFLIVRIYYEQAALNRRWLAKYFVNRFARIYPVYCLLLTIAVLIHHGFRPWVLLTNYTLTHALFSNAHFIIQPSWS